MGIMSPEVQIDRYGRPLGCTIRSCRQAGGLATTRSRYLCETHEIPYLAHKAKTSGRRPYGSSHGSLEKAVDDIKRRSIWIDGCLIWTGGCAGTGVNVGAGNFYGEMRWKGEHHKVHRLTLLLFMGDPSPDKPFALHNCGNTICVTPDHLYWGDYEDNSRDAVIDQSNPLSTLSWDDVMEIHRLRDEGKMLQREIGAIFGVSVSHISEILNGKSRGFEYEAHQLETAGS